MVQAAITRHRPRKKNIFEISEMVNTNGPVAAALLIASCFSVVVAQDHVILTA
jgi:hypothetical protein